MSADGFTRERLMTDQGRLLSAHGTNAKCRPGRETSDVGGRPDISLTSRTDAFDPNRTFASFAGLGYTAIGESATGAVCDSARSSAGAACRLKLCAELIKPTWLKACGNSPACGQSSGSSSSDSKPTSFAARDPFARPRGIAEFASTATTKQINSHFTIVPTHR